ncbi:immunity 26/phosphotriesterase HocA family protein [Pedobacter sp. MC2016-14]|uniref:immunity 26/phosphotriesterase HocA family protein n=1 Tax=Pedobacter sp. MC2016-14 TaxID=2897327 RepID=UPI001E598A7E|nr:immunity 26/phosphotriesterase HocA family protein [Pedobacter sp. MC2016-14]MCD0488056.1 immunity 26/phosphotriesterase HocA family protein [Pedobacter sp. MC2016-14]
MAKKLKTKIGDIFSVPIKETEKRYMQLIAFDLLQLNSDVVRCFSRIYSIGDSPNMEEIINNNVLFYAHCATDFGLKLICGQRLGIA